MYFKKIRLFIYIAAFFIIFCGEYAWASDNLLRLPSIARYDPDRLDEAVRETNDVPINTYLITEIDDIGDVTIDERTIVIGTGGGDCAGLNAFIRRVVLRVAELNQHLKPGEKKRRVVGVTNNYDGMTADDWQPKPAEEDKPAQRGKLTELTPEKVKQAQDLPSTFLGSCRRKLSGEDLAKIAKRFGKAAVIIVSGGNDHLKGVEQIADFIRDPEAVKRNEAGKIAKFIREKITDQKREQLLGDLDDISKAEGKIGDENIKRLKADLQMLHDDVGSQEDLTRLVVKFINFAKAFNEYLEFVEVELSGKKPNLRTVGAPKSIDNDFGDDDKMAMLGFKSAYRFGRQIASRASLDPEKRENKNKVAVFEVMGRGWHSLTENCAKGCPYPYATIIPGKKVSIDEIIDVVRKKDIRNLFVSEGFSLSEKDPKLGELLAKSPMLKAMWDKATDPKKRELDAHGNPKLTGASLYVVGILKHFCGLEVEQTDLTYELRGAFPQADASDPVAFDIALAELFGDAAVSIGLDQTKESGLALTYPGYEDVNRQVTPKPAKDVYRSRKLKDKGAPGEEEEENELAKFGVLGLERGFNAAAQIRNAEVPKIDGSIESAARKFFYGIDISTRTHKGASVVEFRISDEDIVSACGREQDLESLADGRGLRLVVEATKDSVLLLISQERVNFSEIADKIRAIYSKLGYVNIAISNDFALNKNEELLKKILDNDPVLKARFENEAVDLGDGWVKFDSGVSHFIVGLFKECGVKKGTRVTNSGYAFTGLTKTSSPDILKDTNLLARQGVVMAKPIAGRLAADDSDGQRKDKGTVLQLLKIIIRLRDTGILSGDITRNRLIEISKSRHLSVRTIGREIKGLQIAGIIEPRGKIRFTKAFADITLDDVKKMNEAAKDIVNKGLDRSSLNRLTAADKKRLQAAVHDAVTKLKDEVVQGSQLVAVETELLNASAKERLTNIARVNAIIRRSPASARLLAAREITNLVRANNLNKLPTVIGLMAGEDFKDIYRDVIGLTRKQGISWANVVIINADEFMQRGHKDTAGKFSRGRFIEENLLKWLVGGGDAGAGFGLKRENIHMLNGRAKDPGAEWKRFNNEIKGLAVDLQLLDINQYGDIGFITVERDMPLQFLTEMTGGIRQIADSQRPVLAKTAGEEDSNVPLRAYTMSLGQLFQAKEVLTVCTGPEKSGIVKQVVTEGYSTSVLASLMQLHKNAVMIMDKNAGGDLMDLAELSRRSRASRLNEIVVVSAQPFITSRGVDAEAFKAWLGGLPKNCAVVVICMPDQFDLMREYENLAYIQSIYYLRKKAVSGTTTIAELGILFKDYGNPSDYDSFRLAGPYKKGEHLPLIREIVSDIFPKEFFKSGERVDFTEWEYAGSLSRIRIITSPDITAERARGGSFEIQGRPMRIVPSAVPAQDKGLSSSL